MPFRYNKSDIYGPFVEECCYLARAWAVSLYLMIEDDLTIPKRSDIWKTVAPNIYYCLHDALLAEIYAIVCKLTDPDDSMGNSNKPNLTLNRVITALLRPSLEDAQVMSQHS